MKKLFLLFFVLLSSQANALAQSSLPRFPDRDDNQIWHETIVAVPLTEELSVLFSGVLRYSNDAGRFADKRIGFGFSYKVNKYVNAGAFYLYRKTELIEGRESFEHRFVGIITPSKKFGKYTLSNRCQFEHHLRHIRSNKWVYRNRTQIEREINLNGFKIKPFGSAEFYYDSQFEALSRLRLVAGASKKINKNFTLDAYYLRQQDGQTVPGDWNVFGTTLRITLFAKEK